MKKTILLTLLSLMIQVPAVFAATHECYSTDGQWWFSLTQKSAAYGKMKTDEDGILWNAPPLQKWTVVVERALPASGSGTIFKFESTDQKLIGSISHRIFSGSVALGGKNKETKTGTVTFLDSQTKRQKKLSLNCMYVNYDRP